MSSSKRVNRKSDSKRKSVASSSPGWVSAVDVVFDTPDKPSTASKRRQSMAAMSTFYSPPKTRRMTMFKIPENSEAKIEMPSKNVTKSRRSELPASRNYVSNKFVKKVDTKIKMEKQKPDEFKSKPKASHSSGNLKTKENHLTNGNTKVTRASKVSSSNINGQIEKTVNNNAKKDQPVKKQQNVNIVVKEKDIPLKVEVVKKEKILKTKVAKAKKETNVKAKSLAISKVPDVSDEDLSEDEQLIALAQDVINSEARLRKNKISPKLSSKRRHDLSGESLLTNTPCIKKTTTSEFVSKSAHIGSENGHTCINGSPEVNGVNSVSSPTKSNEKCVIL